MSGFIASDRVLQTGGAQCQHCAVGVTNVLVEIHEYTLGRALDFSSRRCWLATHPEGGGFRMHECRLPARHAAAPRDAGALVTDRLPTGVSTDRRVRRATPATVSLARHARGRRELQE
jgi:hypothetical protein